MKNGILTFCFAFVPGAGQMYQGYMKRGLSLATLFFLNIALGYLAEVLIFALPILWMYSFFDTFNLRAQLGAGTAPADDYLIHLSGPDSRLEALLGRRHTLIGWGLVALGGYIIYQDLLMDTLRDLAWRYDFWLLEGLYLVLRRVPEVVLCLALIGLGIWLVRGPKSASRPQKPELEEFCDYVGDTEEPEDGNGREEL